MGLYYFIAYEWINRDGSIKRIENTVTQEHPVKWLMHHWKTYPDEHVAIAFWSEIPTSIGDDFEESQ